VRFLDSRVTLAIVAAIPAVWVLSLPAPPFTDFAEHSLAIAGIRDALFPTTSEHFQPNFASSPYLAYHVVGALLAKLLGSASLANRLLVFLVACAFPLSVRRLLTAFGSPPAYAWFAILPFYCRALTIGFLPFIGSIPIGMLLLAEANGKRTSMLRSTLAMALLSGLLFYSHISSFSIFVPAACLVSALNREKPRKSHAIARMLCDLAWTLVPALLALRFVLTGKLAVRGDGLDDSSHAPMSIARRLYAFPVWIYDNFQHRADDAIAAVYWVLFLWALLATMRAVHTKRANVEWVHIVPSLIAVLVYLITPFQVGAAAFLNVRLAPVLLLLLLPLFRAPLDKRLQAGLAAVSLSGGLVFAYFAREVYLDQGVPLMSITAQVPVNSRTVSLNFVPGSRLVFLDPYPYSASLAAAERGGLAGFSFASLQHWSIHYKDGATPPEHVPFWIFAPCTFRNQTDGAFYDHVIVRGPVEPFRSHPLGPVYELVDRAQMYSLYRKVPGQFWTTENGAGPDDGPCAVLSAPENE
jgi:hypothetical protein